MMTTLATPRHGTPATGTAPTNDEGRAATLVPRVDVLETENELLVLLDLPGVASQDLDIRFEKGELTVHGRRTGPRGAAAYFRTFRVTEQIAADQITADLKHGVLTLTLPKVDAVKPRRITVRG
jgi:HSP20 family protein